MDAVPSRVSLGWEPQELFILASAQAPKEGRCAAQTTGLPREHFRAQ